MAEMNASVIMPTYNRSRFLRLTLASFVKQTTDRFNIILVDDGSTDDTQEVVKQFEGRLRISYLRQQNQGRSKARNAGIDALNADVCIFCDDDRIVPPDYVEAHLRGHAEERNQVVLGWVHGIMTYWFPGFLENQAGACKHIISKLANFPAVLKEFLANPNGSFVSEEDVLERFDQTVDRFRLLDPQWEKKNVPLINKFGDSLQGLAMPWIVGDTGNMSIDAALVKEVRFDEKYSGWGMEDTDLSYRLFKRSAKFRVNKDIACFHQVHPFNPGAKQLELHRNVRYFCQKYDCLDAYLFLQWGSGKMTIENAMKLLEMAQQSALLSEVLCKSSRDLVQSMMLAGQILGQAA